MRYNSQKSDMNMSFSIFFGKKFEKKKSKWFIDRLAEDLEWYINKCQFPCSFQQEEINASWNTHFVPALLQIMADVFCMNFRGN